MKQEPSNLLHSQSVTNHHAYPSSRQPAADYSLLQSQMKIKTSAPLDMIQKPMQLRNSVGALNPATLSPMPQPAPHTQRMETEPDYS